MTTAFPGAIDAFTNPTATDALDSATVPHASQHANVNDAVEAIETAIGTTGAPVLAKLASPTFTGTPTLPTGTIATTQTAADSSTKVATTAFVTTADNLKADLASPTFTGTPATPTAAVGTNTTQIATTAFVLANAGLSFGFTSGLYYRSVGTGFDGITTSVVNETTYVPFLVSRTQTFDRISTGTGATYAGTGTVRMGIYNNDSTTGKPSTVVLDAGTVATTALSTKYEITISQSLAPGAYWLAWNMQSAPTTARYNGIFVTTTSAIGLVSSTSGGTAVTAGVWTQSGVTGAFATAGTLVAATTVATATMRAS